MGDNGTNNQNDEDDTSMNGKRVSTILYSI
jgi:hypothetical protein